MGMTSNATNKKDLNVELNLLPVFDILSVCICFLLMTVVWVEVRAIETKQTFGSQSDQTANPASSLWISIDEKNNVTLTYKRKDKEDLQQNSLAKNGQIDFDILQKKLQVAFTNKVESIQILPARHTKYDQVIKIMDLSKQVGINNIGLSPI